MKLVFKVILILLLSTVLFVLGMDYSDFIAITALLIYLEIRFARVIGNLEKP